MTKVDLLSALYCFNVNGVDAVSMDSINISVRIQLQTQDPLEIKKGRRVKHFWKTNKMFSIKPLRHKWIKRQSKGNTQCCNLEIDRVGVKKSNGLVIFYIISFTNDNLHCIITL